MRGHQLVFCASHCNYFFNCDGKVPIDSFNLGYVANCQMRLQRDRAVRNRVGTHDRIKESCFARTRWSDDANEFSSIDLQINIINNWRIAVCARDVLAVNQGIGIHGDLIEGRPQCPWLHHSRPKISVQMRHPRGLRPW